MSFVGGDEPSATDCYLAPALAHAFAAMPALLQWDTPGAAGAGGAAQARVHVPPLQAVFACHPQVPQLLLPLPQGDSRGWPGTWMSGGSAAAGRPAAGTMRRRRRSGARKQRSRTPDRWLQRRPPCVVNRCCLRVVFDSAMAVESRLCLACQAENALGAAMVNATPRRRLAPGWHRRRCWASRALLTALPCFTWPVGTISCSETIVVFAGCLKPPPSPMALHQPAIGIGSLPDELLGGAIFSCLDQATRRAVSS